MLIIKFEVVIFDSTESFFMLVPICLSTESSIYIVHHIFEIPFFLANGMDFEHNTMTKFVFNEIRSITMLCDCYCSD